MMTMIGPFSLMNLIEFTLRWLHLFFGVIWIGHLYYFNFTQGTFLNAQDVDASAKSALRIKLLPVALWWFRWGAMWTMVTGVLYWGLKGHSFGSFTALLSSSYGTAITVGGIFGITMWANVWHVIWPKQRIVIQNATQVAAGQPPMPNAADAGMRANVASRTNTLLSIPMLFFMGAASHLPLPIHPESNLTLFWILFAVLWAAIEGNAIKGKTFQFMTTVKQVITSGFILAFLILALLLIAI
jgi:uncharacterized membrane protein